jgi:DNA repair protein RadC
VAKHKRPALGDLHVTPSNGPAYGLDDADEPAARGEVCAAVLPKATIQLCMKRKGRPSAAIKNANSVCSFAKGLENAVEENFYALHLDTHHRVIGVDHLGKGTLTGVEVHPREVYKGAILNNAHALIFVHNHPSGLPMPSRQDIELTKRLKQVGELHGIHVLDHVVVGAEGCVSLAESGELEGYAKSKR